jgi:hypothetical protein
MKNQFVILLLPEEVSALLQGVENKIIVIFIVLNHKYIYFLFHIVVIFCSGDLIPIACQIVNMQGHEAVSI